MSRKVSRISTLFLVLGLASVATIFFSIQKSATANIRQPLNINVDDGMLQKYRELSTLSINERKDHFRIASAKDRSDLWKTHFAEYIKTHPDLTQDQLKIIEEGVDLASPIIDLLR